MKLTFTIVAFASALGVLCALHASLSAQTGAAGTWQADASPWKVVLRSDGPARVVGAVNSCASVTSAFEIFDGAIDGNTITFKCRSGDGARTITLRGIIQGDHVTLTWDKQAQDVGNGNGRNGPASREVHLFDDSGPRQFTATRVPDTADAVTETAKHVRVHPTVTFDQILHADREPQNWLTYSGTVLGQRSSPLTQITPDNVKNLELAWLWQSPSTVPKFEATPLVVDGVLYTVEPPNDVVALDAATGRLIWRHPHTPDRADFPGGVCCGLVNRGLAMLGGTLFMGTLDAHLLALDAYSGELLWDTNVADPKDPACKGGHCYAITHAPLVLKDKVIVGVAGGDNSGPAAGGQGIRGFIAAFDAANGEEVWRFSTIPAPGEPGHETWSGDSWRTGGAAVWNTGAYDRDLNLTYWGTGNPNPALETDTRLGDNLYSDSVVALDADTGALKWHYQFNPHDTMDWDAGQVPVLADVEWQGRPRRVMMWANKNGVTYVLDRATGEFLLGKPFVNVNWLSGFDRNGRPLMVPHPDTDKDPIQPYMLGTNWWPPSYSPGTTLFYIPAWSRPFANVNRRSPGHGAIVAFDPRTGEQRWEFRRDDTVFTGVLTTSSDLLFTGTWGDAYSDPAAERRGDGNFYALDARTGSLVWNTHLTGSIQCGPMTYAVDDTQYVAITAGNTLFAFRLRP